MISNNPTTKKAWIHGLPGFDKPGGVPVELFNINAQKGKAPQLQINLKAGAKVMAALQMLLANHTKIPKLSVVVRAHPLNDLDNAYQLCDAHIIEIQPSGGRKGSWTVAFDLSSQFVRKGMRLQPGPPPNAPAVGGAGSNTGYILGIMDDCSKGIAFKSIRFLGA